MRIAFVTEVWKPSINGVVTRLSLTIDELIAAGHEVLVIAPRVDGAGDRSGETVGDRGAGGDGKSVGNRGAGDEGETVGDRGAGGDGKSVGNRGAGDEGETVGDRGAGDDGKATERTGSSGAVGNFDAHDSAGNDRAGESAVQPGLQVRRMPSVRIRLIYGGQPWGLPLLRMRRYLAEFAPDLVHVVAPALLGVGGVRSAKRLGLPLVASFHTDIAGYARFYHLGFLAPFIWWWLRRLHNAAEITLVTSEYSARLLAGHGFMRVVHWRRGVDVRLFDPARRTRVAGVSAVGAGAGASAASAAAADVATDAVATLPIALYVGRLAWEKGLQRLESLARSGAVQLDVIGDGPDRERLEHVFDGTPTRFVGSVTGVELAITYANADLFVFPSTTETLGLVLLEASASGLPIVAAESPASRELLAASPTARLFPADHPELAVQAVYDLLASGSREQLAHAARNGVAGWGWASATAGLVEEYRAVLAARVRVADLDAAAHDAAPHVSAQVPHPDAATPDAAPHAGARVPHP
ncbi:glycosyltransferase [Rathayibacter soli]|uniref:glycosyltransferase n=1 Tax=Rathayibacter soli TaxID=3144168 RepID=UPI0027E3D108|nr:glycosyltransferase [Glaciibacter superstes]